MLKKECDNFVDECISGIFDAFQNACNKADVLCMCIHIPRENMNP